MNSLILQYSSLLRLQSGVTFRVCNVCSKRLPSRLNHEHSTHLKLHEKHWKVYLVLLSKRLSYAIQQSECRKTVHDKKHSSSEIDATESSSSSDSENPFFVPNAVDCLEQNQRRPPPLTTFEHILSRKFTYDKNPIRIYREITDRIVAEYCNVVKSNQIHEEFQLTLRPKLFYASKSEAAKLISRILCEKQCYYLPGECFFEDHHALNFKDLMKKDLHDKFQPYLNSHMTNDSTNIPILQYNEFHQPKVYELCQMIGSTTKLEYNPEGYLDLNYDLFCQQLWDFETPLFVLEENKVYDVILGLLLSADTKFSPLRADISRQYLQTNPGLNVPVLSVMMHGPDLNKYSGASEKCDTSRDVRKSWLKNIVSHPKCISMKNEYHWMYKHNTNDQNSEMLTAGTNISRKGPASLPDKSIVYPCNLGHWHACPCQSCQLVTHIDCEDHKKHMQFNLQTCLIKEATSCPDHKIDHPENVEHDDIRVNKYILFHNEEVLKDGRHLQSEEVILAGMKTICKCCRTITEDHFKNHLIIHSQCNICLFEVKTKDNPTFWGKVCQVCGKKFESEQLRIFHQKKHDVPRLICEICEGTFSSKFNFKRHLVESHNVFLDANNGPIDGTHEDENYKFTCSYCQKDYKYERNVVAHIFTVHSSQDACECKLCGKKITRMNNLKRHLAEQHGMLNFKLSLDRENFIQHSCSICEKVFKRRYNLEIHKQVHLDQKPVYECDLCDATFLYRKTLKKHVSRDHGDQPELECSVCYTKFNCIWNLNRHFKTHTRSKEVFSCQFCDRKYLSRWNLKRHMTMKHGNIGN